MRQSHRVWFNAFVGGANRDATAAARVAGLGKTTHSQNTIGGRLKRRYKHLIEAYELRLAEAAIMSPRQVSEALAEIARDTQERTSDRLKALELVARIHGMLSDKMQIDIDVALVKKELASSLSTLTLPIVQNGQKQLANGQSTADEPPIEAELVPGESPGEAD